MNGQGNNASEAQYGTPTPGPPVGTPVPGVTVQPQPLPHTGSDLVLPFAAGGALLILLGVCTWTIVRPWFERRGGRGGNGLT